jgi:hypothetical protein
MWDKMKICTILNNDVAKRDKIGKHDLVNQRLVKPIRPQFNGIVTKGGLLNE